MYLTTAEAARELNITESAVRKLAERKLLKARKFPPNAPKRGAISLFDPVEVEQLKQDRRERIEKAKRGESDKRGALPASPKDGEQ